MGRVLGLGVGDAQPATPCPEKLHRQGCCDGQTVWWCERGLLWSRDCSGAPQCGWSASGLYGCNTAGAADPAGVHPRDCAPLFGQPQTAPADPCGGIGREGCCDGDTLKYCEGGALQTINCALSPECGWRPSTPMSGHYDCGTNGAEAPRGLYPRLCPGAKPPGRSERDGSADVTAARDAAIQPGDAPPGGGGGGCAAAPTPTTGSSSWLLMAALVLLLRRAR